MTIGMYGNPNYQFISYAFNWGIAYNLPNETISLRKIVDYNANKVVMKRELPRPVLQRSNRREFYSKLETIMDKWVKSFFISYELITADTTWNSISIGFIYANFWCRIEFEALNSINGFFCISFQYGLWWKIVHNESTLWKFSTFW